MVVKVLSGGGGGFGGIDYNEEKVEKGEAHVVEMVNLDGMIEVGDYSAAELKEYFEEYSERNPSVSKPQFHVTFSVKGNEMSDGEIAEIAKKWMAEMGYAEPGQPMVIYAHHDTGNNHIHVITSRVAPDGHKIDHNHERRRGREVMNRLMGERNKVKLDKNTTQILTSYKFSSVNQFMAIYQTSGYAAYTVNTDVILQRDGATVEKIPISEVEKHCQPQDEQTKTINRRKAWGAGQRIMKIVHNSSTREELTANARKRFGLGIVWLGKPDSPYGYIVVDHKNKRVYNGKDVCKLIDLLAALTPLPERLARATSIIDSAMASNPDITTRELNYLLATDTGGRISKGILVLGSANAELRAEVKDALKTNDRVAWVNSFSPTSEIERDVLCRALGVDDTDKPRISISSDVREMSGENIARFKEAYKLLLIDGDLDGISKMGVRLSWVNGTAYGIDFKKGVMADLNSLGIAQSSDQNLRAETILAEMFGASPDITTRELNKELMKQTGCWISKGLLKTGSESIPLSPEVQDALKTNDRIATVNSFHPTTEVERDVLCRLLHIKEPEMAQIHLSSEGKAVNEVIVEQFRDAYRKNMVADPDAETFSKGARIVWKDGICYGIDFKSGTIANLSFLGIQRPGDLRARAEIIVMELVNTKPEITTREINRTLLHLTGCRISKGILSTGIEEIPLSPQLKETLKSNDRIDWACSFNPSNEQERELLHRLTGIDRDKIKVNTFGKEPSKETIAFIADIYRTFKLQEVQGGLNRMGLRVEWQGDRWYCIDYKTRTIVDLKAHGLNTSMFVTRGYRHTQPNSVNMPSAYHRFKNVGQGGGGQKRDWEVGRASEYSDDGDVHSQGMKR